VVIPKKFNTPLIRPLPLLRANACPLSGKAVDQFRAEWLSLRRWFVALNTLNSPPDNRLIGGLFIILTFAFAKDFAFLSLEFVLYFEIP
jgi:hypothetical protein